MDLDLSSLRKALRSLEQALQVASDAAFVAGLSEVQNNTVRAGVIQNFELSYELSWKFIQRWLKENDGRLDAELPRTRKDLFRQSARAGLIDDPLPWFGYGDARNLVAHTYDEVKAEIVYETATRFLPDALALLARLEAKND